MSSTESNIVRSIVMIDDDADFLHVMKRRLEAQRPEYAPAGPVEILPYTDPVEALVNMPAEGICVVFLDYNLQDCTGLDWLPKLIKAALGPVILLTNHNDAKVAAEAFRGGVADFIAKSDVMIDDDRLGRAIREAVHRYRLETRNTLLTRQIKLINGELEAKNKRLAELTETAHQCVDDVAHDFRTPLTVIQQYASIIADGLGGPVTEKQHTHLGVIAEATQELAEMVDDFLDSSKLRARALSMDRRSHTVQELFDGITPMLEVRATPKQISVHRTIADGTAPFFADLSKVSRVLSNLVVNAVKVTPSGGSLQLWARNNDAGDVCVGVTDQGPGVTPQELELIFERFQQLDDSKGGGTKGFGLGLSIVKHLTRLSFGKVQVQSEPGKGSSFAFTLPAYDLTRILNCYLEGIRQLNDVGDLWMLNIRSDNNSWDASTLRYIVSSSCYPMDLVWQEPDSETVHALGVSRDATSWADRLRKMISESKQSGSEGGPIHVEINTAGPWMRDTDRAKLADTLCACFETRSSNAQTSVTH